MAPHQKMSVNIEPSRRSRSASVSSVESAVASTSKAGDGMCMAPLTRSMARSESVSSFSSVESDMAPLTRSRAYRSSSVSSTSSTASTASIHSASSRTNSPAPATPRRKTRHAEPHAAGGKVTKRRKAARLTMIKTKRPYQPKKDAIAKILREEATQDNFILSDLEWSKWKQVIRRADPLNKRDWVRRHPDHVGYRKEIIATDTELPAVYEFAVETHENNKVPVLASVTMGMKPRQWESTMLNKPKIRTQIDRVLRRGCKVYARKARFSAKDIRGVYEKSPLERKGKKSRVSTEDAVNELRGLMLKVHDYAWRDHYDIASRTYSHRPLIVNGNKLSD